MFRPTSDTVAIPTPASNTPRLNSCTMCLICHNSEKRREGEKGERGERKEEREKRREKRGESMYHCPRNNALKHQILHQDGERNAQQLGDLIESHRVLRQIQIHEADAEARTHRHRNHPQQRGGFVLKKSQAEQYMAPQT